MRIAAGQDVSFADLYLRGHAIELRINAEDSERFLPSPGQIRVWQEPTGQSVRVDSGYRAGDIVSPVYDPLLAKFCVWGTSREEALDRARVAVTGFRIEGVKTNLAFFNELLNHPAYVSGNYDTGIVEALHTRRGARIAHIGQPGER